MSLASVLGTKVNSKDLDQTLQITASDQVLYLLPTESFIKIRVKMKSNTDQTFKWK